MNTDIRGVRWRIGRLGGRGIDYRTLTNTEPRSLPCFVQTGRARYVQTRDGAAPTLRCNTGPMRFVVTFTRSDKANIMNVSNRQQTDNVG
ncbi:hypothetical protein RR46_10678 [Papilio xuthus]|uniref:Uncharacterized protein n=1 Tax=Papilio xuthus TaxID=66420 RepID=A0A194PK80_PAPXU|nr:hypothetical protein RR46_10678 [Papilio xuthus]